MFQVTQLPKEKRIEVANKIKKLTDFKLPHLDYFNFSPCEKHETLDIRCKKCGIEPRKHQNVGAAWLYASGNGLLAFSTGLGKTGCMALLSAILLQYNEASYSNRILVICRAAAAPQWEVELNRFLPKANIILAKGSSQQRLKRYLEKPWHICIISDKTFINDAENLSNAFDFSLVCCDDIDPLRTPQSQTHYHINQAVRQIPRVVVATATPVQKRLEDIYYFLRPLGVQQVVGSPAQFEQRYKEKGTKNYKRVEEFSQKIDHMVFRKTPDDIDDIELPTTYPTDIYLDMYPAQLERYQELQRGVLRIIKESGEQTKRAEAMAKFIYGSQICGGLATLGEVDGPRTSAKLDWCEDKLVDGEFSDSKVFVFCMFKNTVRALQARLARNNVGFETIWGENRAPAARLHAQQRFWDDPDCKVMIGTSAAEQSLNLQNARHLINVDHILNFARMTQVAGRINRDGSPEKSKYIHNLYMAGTQETRYDLILTREQNLSNMVLGDSSGIYGNVSPYEMLQMVGGV